MLGGVPLHPALVHFPLAFWCIAPMLGVWAVMSREALVWQLSYWSGVAGCLVALPAMIAGVLDAISVEAGDDLQRDLHFHSGLMSTAWCVFAVIPVFIDLIPPQGGNLTAFFVLQISGVILLLMGAHIGGRLTYKHHMPDPGASHAHDQRC